jgi:hypothetical protein
VKDILATCKKCGAEVDRTPYLRYVREQLVRASFAMVVDRHRATCGGGVTLDVREAQPTPPGPAQANLGDLE